MSHRVNVLGYVVNDPELTYNPQGTPVTKFQLIVYRGYPPDNRQTVTIEVATFRRHAVCSHRILKKGMVVRVDGYLTIVVEETPIGYHIAAIRVAFANDLEANCIRRAMSGS